MEALAAFLGAHAVTMLAIATVPLLIAMTLFWLLLERYGEVLLRAVSRLFGLAAGRLPSLRGAGALARFLGLEALVAFAVAVGAFAAFFELAEETGLDEELGRFDDALSASLREHVTPATLRGFAAITRLGDVAVVAGLAALVALVLLWRGRRRLALAWAAAIALGGALNLVLKALFERVRPPHEHGLVHAEGWSFPSGHASGAMLLYGLLGYLVAREVPPAWRLPVALIAALLIVLVGFSRVILQVHYLSDVLAGYASAAAWSAAWVAGLELARRRGPRVLE